jgi:hypothetical protein
MVGAVVMASRRAGGHTAAAPAESEAVVFLSGFFVASLVSGAGFYASNYAPWASLLVVVGFIVVEAVAVAQMYRSRAVYFIGLGLGLIGGFLARDVIKWLFDGLAYAGIAVGRAVAFATSPKPYDAAALMMFLVVNVHYALVMLVNTVVMSLFISAAASWWRYPDLLFGVGLVVFYPFYSAWIYMFTWGLLYLLFSGSVYMFWLSEVTTFYLGVFGFAEFLLAFAGGFAASRFFTELISSAASVIASMAGVYAESAEIDAFSRSSLLYFIIYSFGAGFSGLVARLYPYYASVFMVAYIVVALGVWSTFVVLPIATRPHARLTWRTLSRVIRNGSTALTFATVAFMVGYSHAPAVIGHTALDFISYYGAEIRRFIGDVVRWILAA